MDDDAQTSRPSDVPTHAIEIVSARVEEMVLEAELLRKAVRENSIAVAVNKSDLVTASKRFRITVALLSLTLAVLFGLSVLNNARSAENKALNARADKILSRIDDCLIASDDPDSCYAQQQARTDDLVGIPRGPINTVTLLTISCAQTHTGEKEILTCVQRRLLERGSP